MTTKNKLHAKAKKALDAGDMSEYFRLMDAAKAMPVVAPKRAEESTSLFIGAIVGMFGLLLFIAGLAGAFVSALNDWSDGAVGFLIVLMAGMLFFVIAMYMVKPKTD